MKLAEVQERLQKRYLGGLPTKIGVLSLAVDTITDSESSSTIRRLAHQIAGSAASFGLPRLGELAREAELAEHAALRDTTFALLAEMESLVEASSCETVRILLVDDDPELTEMISDLIASPCQLVHVARSFAEAHHLLQSNDWDLILLDLMLPDGDGRDLLMRIRDSATSTDTPVVVLSAKTHYQVRNECVVLGVEAFIDKPIDTRTLPTQITSIVEKTRKYRADAYSDPLTGANNRQGFRKLFEKSLSLCERNARPMTVALIDLDHFKAVNDRYGHDAGDVALCAVVQALHDTLRASDIVGRWGGEEFVVAFPETTADQAALALAKVSDALAATPIAELKGETLTFSGGTAQLEPDETLDFALLRADQLLYAAKQQGRNRVLSNMSAVSTTKPRVLLAEDDPALAAMLIKDLSKDYHVTHAANGELVINKAAQHPYDLVLLDYEMPKKDGIEATEVLRAQPAYTATPIIILTAAGSDQIVERAFAAGADDYVNKPYRPRALLARIARHMGRRTR